MAIIQPFRHSGVCLKSTQTLCRTLFSGRNTVNTKANYLKGDIVAGPCLLVPPPLPPGCCHTDTHANRAKESLPETGFAHCARTVAPPLCVRKSVIRRQQCEGLSEGAGKRQWRRPITCANRPRGVWRGRMGRTTHFSNDTSGFSSFFSVLERSLTRNRIWRQLRQSEPFWKKMLVLEPL